MRSAALAAVCVALAACSPFAATAAPDAGVEGDASGTEGGADAASPTSTFCASSTAKGILFCNGFDGSKLTDGWPELQDHDGQLLKELLIGSNRTAHVVGRAGDMQHDRLRSGPLTIPLQAPFVELELKIRLNAALTNVEIATIEALLPKDAITLYLVGDLLKIRVGDKDSSGVALAVGVWSTAKLRMTPSGTTLTVPNGSVTHQSGSQPLLGQSDVHLAVGAYYKEGDGKLDFLLDDVRFTAQ